MVGIERLPVRRYWGKADPQFGAHAFHPLMFHSLDVAAVLHESLRLRPELLDWFANTLNLPPDTTQRLLSWIACVRAWRGNRLPPRTAPSPRPKISIKSTGSARGEPEPRMRGDAPPMMVSL